MGLSEIETKILNKVVDRFVNLKQATERIDLVREFEDPDVIDELHNRRLLKTVDSTYYLPTVLSFEHCGNDEIRADTRRGMEVLAEMFRSMYLLGKIDLSPETLLEEAKKIEPRADERMLRLGLYVAPDFRLLAGNAGGNPQQPDITPTGVSEHVVKLKNIGALWDTVIAQLNPWPKQDSMGGIVERYDDEASLMRFESDFDPQQSEDEGILVFISHSSKDVDLALALIELLRAALNLVPDQIRCSSVDGYRLPVGVNTESKLREEVNAASVVVGLITSSSLSSAFVMFELGARWGADRFLAPLMAGVTPHDLSGPLTLLNALSADSESQIHQFLTNISKRLGLQLQDAASYVRYVSNVAKTAKAVPPIVPNVPPKQDSMVFEESVYWKKNNDKREGPYCTVCYDSQNKEIRLIPGATKGTHRCGVCQNGFRTAEYDPRPVRRRPYSSR